MKITVNHEFYGEIIYIENIWSGKKTISINGELLKKVKGKLYHWETVNGILPVKVLGNVASGVKLSVNDREEIRIVDSPKGYEYLLVVFMFVLLTFWGNSVELCSLIPIAGGAIGGAASGVMVLFTLISMKSKNNIGKKLLIFFLFFIGAFLINFFLAMLLLALV